MNRIDLKNILAYIGLAAIICILEYYIKSEFTYTYLKDNLLTLLLTLLAINTATASVVSAKLESLSDRYGGGSFIDVIKEVKFSLIEQVWLIAITIITLILCNSKVIEENIDNIDIIANVLMLSILIYAIDILRDTGVALFNIVIELNKEE